MRAGLTEPAAFLFPARDFPKIGKQEFPPASGGLAEPAEVAQFLSCLPDDLNTCGIVCGQVTDPLRIGAAVQEEALGRFPVTACPSGLLVIGFEGFGEIVVDNEAYIRLVDPHAERDGRTDDLHGVFQKSVLHALPLLPGKARVVSGCGKTPLPEFAGKLRSPVPAHAVDDPGFVPVPADETSELSQRVLLSGHPVRQVLPVETAHEHLCAGKAELLADILADFGNCRRREGNDRDGREMLADPGELPVFGPEVVAPFRDAVRLVNRYEPDRG